jgi:AraC family transcriptional regulator
MQPRIETINDKKLIGQRLNMSFADYRIGELWKSFGTKRKLIANNPTNDLISLAIYGPTHFADFKPTNEFEKWAAVEVVDFQNVPNELEAFHFGVSCTRKRN